MKTAMQEVANDILEIKDLSMDHIKQIVEILSVKGMKLEKQQIITTWICADVMNTKKGGEQYYNETFKND